MPSLLTGFVNPVQFDQPLLVLKDQRRQLEADSSVLALILPVFPFIPLVAHNVYTYHTTNTRPVGLPRDDGRSARKITLHRNQPWKPTLVH